MWLFYCLNFERNDDVLKSESPCSLFNKNINFNKSETESKTENPPHTFREIPWCFNSYKNRELKVQLWWVGAREIKKITFWRLTFIFSEENFFSICIFSQCIVHGINFQNIYTFTYQKILLHTIFLLGFKIVESLKCILN